MATATLATALKDLESGKVSPIYVVVGEEPFQASEFAERLRRKFLGDAEAGGGFNYDVFDAESAVPADLLASLDTLPGLFDAPDATRLVVCRRFEKASAALLERLDGYFRNPAPQTCFLILADKIDRRKTWIKEVEKAGTVLEVADPWDRDWPKWKPFFEKRTGKSMESGAWDALVEASNRTLALVATECEKVALYIGERKEITRKDVLDVCGGSTTEDIFQLSEDIVAKRSMAAMLKLQRLLLAGESEIKILSLVLRLFRQVAQCRLLMDTGVRDPKLMASQIGVPPFFVPKIQGLAQGYGAESLAVALRRLADCDYRLKTGEGSLWGDFLVPHFQNSPAFY